MFDMDLLSIQEARTLVRCSREAMACLAEVNQTQIDDLVESIACRCAAAAEKLARKAVEETGFGRWQDKMQKNLLASEKLWVHIQPMKTVGVIAEDFDNKILNVAAPVGVVAAVIPSTNPTSTTIYKTLISLKGRNSVIFSPHPNAKNCIHDTVQMIREVIGEHGFDENLVSVMSYPSLDGTQELMKYADLIIATGGPSLVKAAYRSGTLALGVGAGNVPVFIERTADLESAVDMIMESKLFDNGTVCASEQAIIAERVSSAKLRSILIEKGCFFLEGEDLVRMKRIMERSNGSMNPTIVGQNAETLALIAGISIPAGTRLLIADEPGVGPRFPFSKEKLTALLGYYEVEDWRGACELCFALLDNGGIGRFLAIHSKDDEIVREFALKKPVSRLLVNTPSTHGAIGLSTHLAPSLTLGYGTTGGSPVFDNVDANRLINIKKVAYGFGAATGYCQRGESTRPLDIEDLTNRVLAELQQVR